MRRPGLLALAALLAWPLGRASELPNPSTLSVGLTIPAVCTVGGATLDFGASTSGPVVSQTSVTVNCNQGQAWMLSANAGIHFEAGSRNLQNGSGQLVPYLLYTDEALFVEMGDGEFEGSYPAGVPVSGVGTGSPQAVPIFGLIPVFDSGLPAGSYTDEVLLTVHF